MGTDNPASKVENEFKEIDSRDGWLEVFHAIRTESLKNKYSTQAATNNKNKNLNRYRDVSPYDHSRIILKKGKCDYINANLVKIDEAGRRYILTQGPLSTTTGHFWLMVWEQKSEAIIMLNRIVEKNQEKCSLYWPMGSSNIGVDTMTFTDVGLEVTYVKEDEASYFTTRTLKLKDLESGESRTVLHFHYTAWPDFGVPQSPAAFLRFLSAVRRSGTLEVEGPAVVHCSAGIGRSGTFCLVDSCLVIMKKNGNNSVNVREMLLDMRKYRMGLIQTSDQLRFSYLAIIEGITRDWDNVNDNDPLDDGNGNWNDKVESSSSDDEPPPLPPPRVESRPARPPDELPLPPDRPLPSVPPTPDSQPDTPVSPVENDLLIGLTLGDPDLPQLLRFTKDQAKFPGVHNLLPHRPEMISLPEQSQKAYRGASERKRKHDELTSRTAEKVAEMKRKQESAEKWRSVKRSLIQPFGLGLGAFLVGGGAIALYFYFNR